jgi:hypothetical protein
MTSLLLNIESEENLILVKELADKLGIDSKILDTEDLEDMMLGHLMEKIDTDDLSLSVDTSPLSQSEKNELDKANDEYNAGETIPIDL